MVALRIAALLEVAPGERDEEWLRQSIDAAIALELSTIPPYLCAMWSIKDPGAPAAKAIRGIVLQEMAHMGLMANLQSGIGNAPVIRGAAPKYPTQLPGHVREQLTVSLGGLTPALLHDVLMEIEMPEQPVAFTIEESFPTIGAFYDALSAALEEKGPPFDPARQLERKAFGVVILRTVDDAKAAIARIKGQGEGSTMSAEFEGRLAHYYELASIYHGRRLIETGGGWRFEGAVVPFPEVWPMAVVPDGGWPERDPDGNGTLQMFNEAYASVLDGLQRAWTEVNSSLLTSATNDMRSLADPAQMLMQVPRTALPGNYGPDFIV
ncbi:MAG TPA: ferritin-like protein [Thermoanaerobaculia bacterium]|jgi:hypothetical protein|nr:ferritin-like protein [Thermoanaerobaculia bacterium]